MLGKLLHFKYAIGLTLVALGIGLGFGGPAVLFAVIVLGILEVSLSFDNAVVNAKVLRRMDPIWQQIFLTVGILIAVFGMRLVLPLVIVAVTAGLGTGEVIDLAFNDPDAYGAALESAKEAIYAFGGTFLLMIFLDFVLDGDREIHWLRGPERALARVGALNQVSVIVAVGAVLGSASIVADGDKATVLTAGLIGLLVYLIVKGFDTLLSNTMEDGVAKPAANGAVRSTFKAGLFAFLYLEVLDASFSFDGVIGAFAISNDILVIALGLGIGAFWIRSMTVYMVKRGTLDELIYLEHGAHWAIGVLAVIMLVQVKYHVPEAITGLTGVLFIVAAAIMSVRAKNRLTAEQAEAGTASDTSGDDLTAAGV